MEENETPTEMWCMVTFAVGLTPTGDKAFIGKLTTGFLGETEMFRLDVSKEFTRNEKALRFYFPRDSIMAIETLPDSVKTIRDWIDYHMHK